MTSLSMRRFGLNALLLVIVLSLAALVWWQLQQKEQQAQTDRLLPITFAEVTSILIERQTESVLEKIELQREGDDWRLLQPVAAEANAIKVRQLLTLLDDKVESSYSSADKDLKQYGLAPSDLSVSFNGSKLVLGDSNPVSNQRYILNGQQIQLVNEAVYGLLKEDWVNFISLKLVPNQLKLETVQLPEGFADSPQLVSAWKVAEAVRVKAFDPQQATPDMQKVILKGASESQELLVVKLTDEIVLADLAKQCAYTLPISQAAQLFPSKTGLGNTPK
ncbi:MAG: DUF4340 domain-containing protein [Thiolinea sp.]